MSLAPIFRWAAAEHLATPTHLISRSSIRRAVAYLRSHLDARISYATKANTHPLVLETLRDLVDEFNVTNPAHLETVLGLGISPDRIVYLNPVVSPEAARAIVASGVRRFVVDDLRGLNILTALGADLQLTLRLRPTRDGQARRSVIRFGTTGDALRQLATTAVECGSSIEALSFFVGTNSVGMKHALPYRLALKELAAVHAKLAVDGIDVPTVNIGGAFPGARRRFHQQNPGFFKLISEELAATFPQPVGVVCEPGRFLSEPSMALLSRVVADRRLVGERMTYLDASAYSGLFETTFIEPGGTDLTVAVSRSGPATATQLLGPIMDSFDVIKRMTRLPSLREGDMVLFPNTGAYSYGYAAACEGMGQPPAVPLPAELDDLLADEWFD